MMACRAIFHKKGACFVSKLVGGSYKARTRLPRGLGDSSNHERECTRNDRQRNASLRSTRRQGTKHERTISAVCGRGRRRAGRSG